MLLLSYVYPLGAGARAGYKGFLYIVHSGPRPAEKRVIREPAAAGPLALAVSYALAGAAIALLAVYGADVAAAKASGGGDDGAGFLPFDHMARGLGLGLPSMALPIAAFFISRREPSRALGCLLAAAGVLIIVGGAVVLAVPPGQPDAGMDNAAAADADAAAEAGEGGTTMSERSPVASAAPLLAAGSFIVALGAIKVRRS